MTKLAFTPGPWFIGIYDATADFKDIDKHVAICTEKGALLATCGPIGDGPTIADANLIAAAPDLLKELKSLCAYFSEWEKDYPDDKGRFSGALAAIEKAEGRMP